MLRTLREELSVFLCEKVTQVLWSQPIKGLQSSSLVKTSILCMGYVRKHSKREFHAKCFEIHPVPQLLVLLID